MIRRLLMALVMGIIAAGCGDNLTDNTGNDDNGTVSIAAACNVVDYVISRLNYQEDSTLTADNALISYGAYLADTTDPVEFTYYFINDTYSRDTVFMRYHDEINTIHSLIQGLERLGLDFQITASPVETLVIASDEIELKYRCRVDMDNPSSGFPLLAEGYWNFTVASSYSGRVVITDWADLTSPDLRLIKLVTAGQTYQSISWYEIKTLFVN